MTTPGAAFDRELLAASGFFDEAFYRDHAKLPAGTDALHHYLTIGWHWGLRPRADFESGFVQPYYEASGLVGPPLLTWVALSAVGGQLPCSEWEAQWRAERIRPSALYDPGWYAQRLPDGIDPALHYVLAGEALGWRPSPNFDPVFYAERHPDIPAIGLSPLLHFEHSGQREGRRALAAAERLDFPPRPGARPCVVVMAHEASRTGAPILGWVIAEHLARRYEVVSVLFRGGALEPAFASVSSAVVGPMSMEEWHPAEMSRVAERIVSTYRPLYAIANSIETNLLVPPLAQRGVPSVALVHEFAAYTRPVEKMHNVFDWATDVVFPAEIVAGSARQMVPHLARRRGLHVFAQGRVDPPSQGGAAPDSGVAALVRPAGAEHAFVVLGAGSVEIRKGVDIFFSVAAAVRRLAPELDIRFAWIGGGYDPMNDQHYSAYLAEQYARSGLDGVVAMLKPVADLDRAYEAADAFLMCSRLDPQPNVGIDAITRGLPVVCFEGASGTAEVLGRDPETRALVAPHLDAAGAAGIICGLARNRAAHAAMSEAVRRVGRQAYDMDGYVERIDRLGRAAAAALHDADRATLSQPGLLDPNLALPPSGTAPGLDGLATVVQQQWAVVGTSLDQAGNAQFRRPCAGFHPQAYAAAHLAECGPGGWHPLAHWVRAGRPAGPWSRPVFPPLPAAARAPLRVGLHAHFHYDALAPELAARLARNATPCDLVVTTDTADKAARLRRCFLDHAGAVDVRIVPNRGRDIGPFLACLGGLADHDVVGHLHGKGSAVLGKGVGDAWRTFLWDNLVGEADPMLDTAAAAFAADPALGLLMAEDPHLVGWDENRAIAEALAARMGIGALDTFFDFPLGTMFWARPAALAPLLALGLSQDDYPPEPLPYDGTVLHALERLVPFAARHAGFTVAGLRVPGTSW